ncbi:MAG: undecaprenyl-diphosphatase UppP [Gemmatimonadetes bacterium]|nr:undecaprenyl-diphosphatase UppP [Gemmatimonadota bacterium]MBI3567475.1 undecaprenyl-diphosphatase UppP [Gemmatimonadota bacterium]
MNDITVFQAFILGALQGIAEFLPISSSAHLALAPWAFRWPEPGLAFDVALHVGTLVALLWYFRAEWVRLARAGVNILVTRRVQGDDERRAFFIVIATIPGGIAGKLLKDQAETAFRAPALTATALIVMGALLWLADARSRRDRAAGSMRWTDALLVGCAQAFAIIPGVSRSGATITAGRFLGFNRADAAVFSFLMSMPIIAAAAALELPKALQASGAGLPLLVGVATAAVSSWFAITVVLRFVQTRSFAVFAWYRFLLAGAVFALLAVRGG